ncbi:MAG: hypothetical protein C0514_00080 [Candidatus Puniceispirillum sp.]|nr:hypothetical protein [Candidatus Puniceispirillum sp.]
MAYGARAYGCNPFNTMTFFAKKTFLVAALLATQTLWASSPLCKDDSDDESGGIFMSPDIFWGRVRHQPFASQGGEVYKAPPSPTHYDHLDDRPHTQMEDAQTEVDDSEDDNDSSYLGSPPFSPSPPPGQGHTYVPPYTPFQDEVYEISNTHGGLQGALRGDLGELMHILSKTDEHTLPDALFAQLRSAMGPLQEAYQKAFEAVREVSTKLEKGPPYDN